MKSDNLLLDVAWSQTKTIQCLETLFLNYKGKKEEIQLLIFILERNEDLIQKYKNSLENIHLSMKIEFSFLEQRLLKIIRKKESSFSINKEIDLKKDKEKLVLLEENSLIYKEIIKGLGLIREEKEAEGTYVLRKIEYSFGTDLIVLFSLFEDGICFIVKEERWVDYIKVFFWYSELNNEKAVTWLLREVFPIVLFLKNDFLFYLNLLREFLSDSLQIENLLSLNIAKIIAKTKSLSIDDKDVYDFIFKFGFGKPENPVEVSDVLFDLIFDCSFENKQKVIDLLKKTKTNFLNVALKSIHSINILFNNNNEKAYLLLERKLITVFYILLSVIDTPVYVHMMISVCSEHLFFYNNLIELSSFFVFLFSKADKRGKKRILVLMNKITFPLSVIKDKFNNFFNENSE